MPCIKRTRLTEGNVAAGAVEHGAILAFFDEVDRRSRGARPEQPSNRSDHLPCNGLHHGLDMGVVRQLLRKTQESVQQRIQQEGEFQLVLGQENAVAIMNNHPFFGSLQNIKN